MENMDFHKPMFIGDVASLKGEVTYASSHSCEVSVKVYAESAETNHKRLTNEARCWFASVRMPTEITNSKNPKSYQSFSLIQTLPMPPLLNLSEENKLKGETRYLKQKANRATEIKMAKLIQSQNLKEWHDRIQMKEEFDHKRGESTVAVISQV